MLSVAPLLHTVCAGVHAGLRTWWHARQEEQQQQEQRQATEQQQQQAQQGAAPPLHHQPILAGAAGTAVRGPSCCCRWFCMGGCVVTWQMRSSTQWLLLSHQPSCLPTHALAARRQEQCAPPSPRQPRRCIRWCTCSARRRRGLRRRACLRWAGIWSRSRSGSGRARRRGGSGSRSSGARSRHSPSGRSALCLFVPLLCEHSLLT